MPMTEASLLLYRIMKMSGTKRFVESGFQSSVKNIKRSDTPDFE